MASIFLRDPSDVTDFLFDFAGYTNGNADSVIGDWLAVGETISTKTVTPDSSITVASSAIVNTNTGVRVWISGGTDGVDSAVACKIVTSASRTLERSMVFRTRNL